MLTRVLPRQFTAAHRWLNRQLWQHDSPASFFDPLLETVHPLWVWGQVRAQVVKVHPETSDTLTFTLRPNYRWKGFEAGQHTNLTAQIDGVRQTRTFSLSSSPEQFQRQGLVSFTIKRIKSGTVTPWLHQQLEPGHVVELTEAFGDFTLPPERKPLFYLAGGSGITPILSHLQSLAAQKDSRSICLIYLARDEDNVIASGRLAALQKQLPGLKMQIIHTRERTAEGKLTAADIAWAARDLSAFECYLCGPHGLVEFAKPLLEEFGAQSERIHRALFSAPIPAVTGDSQGALVRHSTGAILPGDGQATLLEIAERAGLNPAYGCRQGICRQCACKKTSGLVVNRLTGRLSGPGEEIIQPCISLPQGAVTVEI